MIITNIIVSNFRGISKFEAVIKGGLLSIVGQNDSGKSSILRAICIFFEKEKITLEDFPKYNMNLPIEIEMHIKTNGLDDIKHNEILMLKQIFKLDDNKIVNEKRIYTENNFPSEEELENYTALKSFGKSIGVPFPTKKPDQDCQNKLKQEVFNIIRSSPRHTWQDAGRYWTDIKEKFPEVVYIPASQDHNNEQKLTSDSSVFGQLFRVGIRNWLKADKDSREATKIIEKKVSEINDQILAVVEKKLKEQLPIAENLSQKLDPLDISKGFSFTMQVKDGQGIDTPLYQRGSGLQRAVLIAAIRAQNEVRELLNNLNNEDNNIIEELVSQQTLYILEEPEAFLHLAAQKELFYSLKDLAEKQNQIIMTTHSTLFMDENDMEDVVLLNRNAGKTISVQHIPVEDVRGCLGEQIKISELLTGKVCCIVEGISDKQAFERWMRTLGYDTKRLGIHFISMDGCKNADYFANIAVLNDFKVPFRIILDNDQHGESKNYEKKQILENKYTWLKRGYIKLLDGELENYFCLDAVARELKIPRELISEEDYKKDPKEALDDATRKAIDSGHKGARRYKEAAYSKKIAESMSKDKIHGEIVEVIEDLVKLTMREDQNDGVIEEIIEDALEKLA